MRTVDTQQNPGQLGKPIRPPEPGPEIDQWEPYKSIHGPMLRNKRTGALRTLVQPKGPQFKPSPAIDFILDLIQKQREAQEEDGFPISEFGGM